MSVAFVFDLIFVAVLLLFVGIGVFRGFIKSFVRSTRWILAFLAANTFGSLLGSLLNSLFIGAWVYDGVLGAVKQIFEKAGGDMDVGHLLSSFPGFLVEGSVRKDVEIAFSEQSGDALVRSVSVLISDRISALISGAVGFILVLVLAFLLLRILASLLTNGIDKIALLGTVNRILGGVWGCLIGVFLLLIVSALITLFFRDSEVYTDTVIVRWFCDSVLLSFCSF